MQSFNDFNLTPNLQKALRSLGFTSPTPIQRKSFKVVSSGKDVIGIAQTGTGKTLAYLLPVFNALPFSKEHFPRVLIIVPTRELVVQVVEEAKKLGQNQNLEVIGVYGGVNINTQKKDLEAGHDLIVATPGRLYDLVLSRSISLKQVKKLIIDEVDVMLDLGFRFQLTNIFDLLPERRQNIMFSATMTDDIESLIAKFFKKVKKVSVAVSGTPLENISQFCYPVKNFYTKVNLLSHLLTDAQTYSKVLVFVSNKRRADRLFEALQEFYNEELCVIHSNKTQNYRLRSIRQFDEGKNRIMVTTDVMARGLDLNQISHVFNFDTPTFPENYMHRIGRTGRAEEPGTAILFYTQQEADDKFNIEYLMDTEITALEFPAEVEVSKQLAPEERPKVKERHNPHKQLEEERGASYHEKADKNKKTNQGGSYREKIKSKYKKPKTRGDKNFNRRKKR